MQFNLELDEEAETKVNNEQKLMIFRIIQEQISNILKYAKAGIVTIRVDVEDSQAIVVVRDNGIGFHPEDVRTGIGLKNMRSRLQAFSGQLNIQSAPQQGCEVRASFSLL